MDDRAEDAEADNRDSYMNIEPYKKRHDLLLPRSRLCLFALKTG